MRRRMVVGLLLFAAFAEAAFLLLFGIDYLGARRAPLWERAPAARDAPPQLDFWVGRISGIEYGVTRSRPRPETASS